MLERRIKVLSHWKSCRARIRAEILKDPIDQDRVRQEDHRRAQSEERRAGLQRNLQPGDVASLRGLTAATELDGQTCATTNQRWLVRIVDSGRYVRVLNEHLAEDGRRRWDEGMEGQLQYLRIQTVLYGQPVTLVEYLYEMENGMYDDKPTVLYVVYPLNILCCVPRRGRMD